MSDRFSRQSFLGPNAEKMFAKATIGVVGLGGGGSHVVQQLAHLGFRNFVLYDSDVVEESNLNRLIGATVDDADHRTPKIDVATRVIRGQCRDAMVNGYAARWQDMPEALRTCDIVFGCVDSFAERDQLERTCRRHLIPLIDIGLDVFTVVGVPPRMAGQVILSMPGGPCLRCLRFLTEENLAAEAARYGDAGPRPQVVFGNGVLASAAVACAVDLLTDWTCNLRGTVYLEYQANEGVLRPHPRLEDKGVPTDCPHYPPSTVGEPVFVPM